jgi:hypothetical protein
MLTARWGRIGTATTKKGEEEREECDHEETVFDSVRHSSIPFMRNVQNT